MNIPKGPDSSVESPKSRNTVGDVMQWARGALAASMRAVQSVLEPNRLMDEATAKAILDKGNVPNDKLVRIIRETFAFRTEAAEMLLAQRPTIDELRDVLPSFDLWMPIRNRLVGELIAGDDVTAEDLIQTLQEVPMHRHEAALKLLPMELESPYILGVIKHLRGEPDLCAQFVKKLLDQDSAYRDELMRSGINVK